MRTWKEIKDYLIAECGAECDEDDFIEMEAFYKNNRSQVVYLTNQLQDNKTTWIKIISPIGNLSNEKVNDVLETIGIKLLIGGLIKSEDMFFLRHCIPLYDISKEELLLTLAMVAQDADYLEKKYLGVDEL